MASSRGALVTVGQVGVLCKMGLMDKTSILYRDYSIALSTRNLGEIRAVLGEGGPRWVQRQPVSEFKADPHLHIQVW